MEQSDTDNYFLLQDTVRKETASKCLQEKEEEDAVFFRTQKATLRSMRKSLTPVREKE